MSAEPIILAQDLTKHYRVALKEESLLATLRHFLLRQYRTVKAVEGVSFQIARGEVVGFLGPNGAGKTTTLKMLTGLIHCAKCGGAMTIRTGKGGRYRYYACSMKARQGPTACEGMAVPMDKLDNLVADHLESQLLQPERLEAILASVLDRRQEQSQRRREHIAELNKRATESELRLKRLYDAIEAGVADIDDPALKDRIDGLKAIRDQAKADAERAQAMLDSSGSKAVTPQMVRTFAKTARQRIRLEGGGYRRDHLRALAQRVEVADGEVRIMGSKTQLLQALVSGGGVSAVPTQGLKWRRGRDSNPR